MIIEKTDYEYVVLSIIPEQGTDKSWDFCFMLRPEYEHNLRILIITIPESETEIEHKIPSWVWVWVWDLLIITTPCLIIQTQSPAVIVLSINGKHQARGHNYLLISLRCDPTKKQPTLILTTHRVDFLTTLLH